MVALRVVVVAVLLFVVSLTGRAFAASDPGDVLEDDSYRFCHEEDYPLYPDERAWCDLVGDTNHRCPDLPDACKNDKTPKAGRGRWELDLDDGDGDGKSPTGDGDGDGKRAGPPDGDRREAKPERADVELPTGLGALAQVVFFLVVALGIGLLIYVIAKNLIKDKDKGEREKPDENLAVPEEEPVYQGPVETDVDRLLRMARDAAARGDFEQAIELAYAALLRRLDGDGAIDIHHSRTNGDYVRRLVDPHTRMQVRDVVRDVERVQFGTIIPDAGLFQSLLARIGPLIGRALTLLLLLAVPLANGSCKRVQDEAETTRPKARGSRDPSGSGAVVALLNAEGADARYRMTSLDQISDDVTALVILPDGGPAGNYDAVLAWVRKGGRLIIAGGAVPAEFDLGYVRSTSEATELYAGAAYRYLYDTHYIATPPEFALDIGDAPRFRPMLMRDDEVYAAQRAVDRGEVVVLADAQLFKNIALTVHDNGEFVSELLASEEHIEFADRWTGAGASTPLESVHEARLTPIIAQLLLLLALLFLWKGRAFGTLKDPPKASRRSFGDHVRALGTQYARAGAGGYALGLYANWAIEKLRERMPRGSRRSMSALAEAIAVRTGRDERDVLRVLVEAQSAGEFSLPPSFRPASSPDGNAIPLSRPSEDIEIMRKLDTLLAQTSRGRDPKST